MRYKHRVSYEPLPNGKMRGHDTEKLYAGIPSDLILAISCLYR